MVVVVVVGNTWAFDVNEHASFERGLLIYPEGGLNIYPE